MISILLAGAGILTIAAAAAAIQARQVLIDEACAQNAGYL